MKLILDFDDVIFHSRAFKTTLFEMLEKEGVHDVLERYDKERKEGNPFSLRHFLAILGDATKEERVYRDIMVRCPLFVNDRVLRLMEEHGKENCYIVTHGDREFQIDKIRHSIGVDAVREIVVVPKSKAEAIRRIAMGHKHEDVIFVDDRLHFINDLPFGGGDLQNLKTVFFNEHGFENLQAEIEASIADEKKRDVMSEMESGYGARRAEDRAPGAGQGMPGRLH
jgi:FMN phosphatase YigB (HAD superfamily)